MVVVADPVAMDPAVMLAVPAEAAALVANPHPLGLSCSFVDVLCFNMTSQIVLSINFFFCILNTPNSYLHHLNEWAACVFLGYALW